MTRPANILQAQAINMKIVNNFYAFLFVVTAVILNFTGHRTQDTGHRTQDTGHRTQDTGPLT